MDPVNSPSDYDAFKLDEILLLNELRDDGFKNIMNKCQQNETEQTCEKYLERKEFFRTYLTLYLSSANMKIENLKTDDKNNISNINFIKKLLTSDINIFEKYFLDDINILTTQAIKNIINIVHYFSSVHPVKYFNIEETINIYKYLLENPICKDIIIKNFWYGTNGTEMTETIIGKIFNSYGNIKYDITFWGKESEYKPIFNILTKEYKSYLINWFVKLISFNKNYSKTAYVINPEMDKTLSSSEFLLISLEMLLTLYYDARINYFKTINDLDKNLFSEDKLLGWWGENVNIENKTQEINLYSIIFALGNKLFDYGLIPVIEKIRKNDRTIQQLKDLIDLEENSVRWNSSFSSMKEFYIKKLSKKISMLTEKNKKYTAITDSSNFIRYLRFYINDLCDIIMNQYFENLPKNMLENIANILDFTKNQIKSNIIGDNSDNIIKLSINTLKYQDEKTFIKLKFLNFISVNNHIISEILINPDNFCEFTLREYIQCLISFYHKIDSNGSNYYNKMSARYKINGIISKFLVLYNNCKEETISIFDSKHNWKKSLEDIFCSNDEWKKLIHLLISDSSFYFEEIISSINKISELKSNNSNLTNILTNEDRIQQQVITMSTYTIYLESSIELLDKFMNISPEYIINSLNLKKFINSLTFLTYSILDDKNKNIFSFDFKKYKINYNWNILLEFVYSSFCYTWSSEEEIEIGKILNNIRQWYSSSLFEKLDETINIGDNSLKEFIKKIEVNIQNLADVTSDEIEEIPFEFCDPIMMTPIEEPILLPESKIVMEKSIIISHLINDETDPFNRTKLTIEELENFNKLPETIEVITNFKERLEKWKNDSKSKKS
jgi:hypothetical protein